MAELPNLRRRGNIETDSIPFTPPHEPPFRPLLQDERSKNDPAYIPEQFRDRKRNNSDEGEEIPYRSLLLALTLLLIGLCTLITFISDVWNGYDYEKNLPEPDKDNKHPVLYKRSERFYPLLFFSFISLVPGTYITFLFLMAFLKMPGYSFSDIPN